VYCSYCGKDNLEGARFCQYCGNGLTQAAVGQSSVEYAGFWLRFVASIIDSLLTGIVCMIFIIPFYIARGEEPLYTDVFWFIMAILVGYVIPWLYYSLMEASVKQATLGKTALGIIVTDEAGNRISFARATGRHFAEYLSQFTIYIGYIMIAFTKKKQGLHDLIASTLVVKKK